MATLDDIRALGYTVEVAHPFTGFAAYEVVGPGLSTQVRARPDGTGVEIEDQRAIDSFANPQLHAERVYQAKHGHPSERAPLAGCTACFPL